MVGSQTRRHVELQGQVSGALKIRTTPGDIENSGRQQRCGSCSTVRLWNRAGNAPFAMNYSPTTTTSYQTTLIPRVWEEHGETTILTTSKQLIGGATRKKGRQELTNDGRSGFSAYRMPEPMRVHTGLTPGLVLLPENRAKNNPCRHGRVLCLGRTTG